MQPARVTAKRRKRGRRKRRPRRRPTQAIITPRMMENKIQLLFRWCALLLVSCAATCFFIFYLSDPPSPPPLARARHPTHIWQRIHIVLLIPINSKRSGSITVRLVAVNPYIDRSLAMHWQQFLTINNSQSLTMHWPHYLAMHWPHYLTMNWPALDIALAMKYPVIDHALTMN